MIYLSPNGDIADVSGMSPQLIEMLLASGAISPLQVAPLAQTPQDALAMTVDPQEDGSFESLLQLMADLGLAPNVDPESGIISDFTPSSDTQGFLPSLGGGGSFTPVNLTPEETFAIFQAAQPTAEAAPTHIPRNDESGSSAGDQGFNFEDMIAFLGGEGEAGGGVPSMESIGSSLGGQNSTPDLTAGFETGSDGTISSAMGVELLEIMFRMAIQANQERRAQQEFEFEAQDRLAALAADPFTAIQALNLGFGVGTSGLPSGFLGELNAGGFPGLSGAQASSNPAFSAQNNATTSFQAGGQQFEAPRLLSGQQFSQLSSRLPEALDFLTSANKAGGNKAFPAEQLNSLIPTGVLPTAAF